MLLRRKGSSWKAIRRSRMGGFYVQNYDNQRSSEQLALIYDPSQYRQEPLDIYFYMFFKIINTIVNSDSIPIFFLLHAPRICTFKTQRIDYIKIKCNIVHDTRVSIMFVVQSNKNEVLLKYCFDIALPTGPVGKKNLVILRF